MMNKICIIIPYFGNFPIWFDLYLYSCYKNSFIDFYFFTDCEIPIKIYNNTHFFKISFDEYCEKVSKKLDIQFKPQKHVKLCDVKPYYGLIHADIVNNYDFWGFGDIDVLYGDLKIILKESTLLKYDLISSHADRVAGHFTIIRKDSKYTTMPLHIDGYQQKLLAENVVGLDEHYFTALVYPFSKWIWKAYRKIGNKLGIKYYNFFKIPNAVFHLFSRFELKEYLTSILPKKGEIWYYDLKRGTVTGPLGKLPYLHFLFFKKNRFYKAETCWEEGFYKLDPKSDYENMNVTIEITNSHIKISQ